MPAASCWPPAWPRSPAWSSRCWPTGPWIGPTTTPTTTSSLPSGRCSSASSGWWPACRTRSPAPSAPPGWAKRAARSGNKGRRCWPPVWSSATVLVAASSPLWAARLVPSQTWLVVALVGARHAALRRVHLAVGIAGRQRALGLYAALMAAEAGIRLILVAIVAFTVASVLSIQLATVAAVLVWLGFLLASPTSRRAARSRADVGMRRGCCNQTGRAIAGCRRLGRADHRFPGGDELEHPHDPSEVDARHRDRADADPIADHDPAAGLPGGHLQFLDRARRPQGPAENRSGYWVCSGWSPPRPPRRWGRWFVRVVFSGCRCTPRPSLVWQ